MDEWTEYASSTYDIVRRPTEKARSVVKAALDATADYWEGVGLPGPRVMFARDIPSGHLARAIAGSGSAGAPLLIIDYDLVKSGGYDEVEVTLLHELVHLFYDSAFLEDERLAPGAEEEVAESTAHMLWERRLDADKLRGYLEGAVTGLRANPPTDYRLIWEVPTTPLIEEIESAWAGGVADFGDPRAAEAIVRVPGYTRYRQSIVRAVEKLPLVEYLGTRGVLMYRSMDRDDAEFMHDGGSVGAKGFTFRRDVAEGWRGFAAHQGGGKDLVVVTAIVPMEGIVMRGKREEAELVVDTGWVQDVRLVS